MHRLSIPFTLTLLAALAVSPAAHSQATPAVTPATEDLVIVAAKVDYVEELDLLVFEQTVQGIAGGTSPTPAGQLDGAPVLGYVFPTTLSPRDVGFSTDQGILALAATAHPDFDDTPLWDENNDRRYDNDGIVFHSHWVVLQPDERVSGGLAVSQIAEEKVAADLPPTNPGMPLLLDSPGFSVVLRGSTLRILVPAQRVGHRTDFNFDAVAAYMEVSTAENRPMLGVYQVYSVLSGELTLPFRVSER